VNLPARDKMTAPRYQDVAASELPVARTPDGLVTVKVIAGTALGVAAHVQTRTPILYFDATVQPGGSVGLDVPADFNVAVYVYDGEARIADAAAAPSGTFAILGEGDRVSIACDARARTPARALVLGGAPIGEPVARYGPFVMNTEAEIHQAIDDFRSGRFGDIAR
jgi:redox-sensitive bicupin YhaK (pirin superfamily)